MSSLAKKFERYLAWTSDHPLALEVDRAQGPYIFLRGGRRLVDFISGIAVNSLGHRHPRVMQAIQHQLDRHLHVMVYGEMVQGAQVTCAEKLVEMLPPSLEVCYFTNSGTEANEGALKVAKKYTGRRRLVGFERSFHGDSHGSLSVTGREVYREPFEPLLPEVDLLPFDDPSALQAIDEATAAVITEPIQGEGGVRIPSRSWMQALRDRCTEVGALLIFDEVQTGLARTGRLFGFEHFDVVPDIITLAKSLGGGMPLGAFLGSREVLGSLRSDPPLNHVTTFGGHPVSCAAASAALDVIRENSLPERSQEIGERIRNGLKHPLIREIRGRGALLGMELVDRETTQNVVKACLARDILLGWTLHSDTLVRMAPPLTIPFGVLDRSLSRINDALDHVQETHTAG